MRRVRGVGYAHSLEWHACALGGLQRFPRYDVRIQVAGNFENQF